MLLLKRCIKHFYINKTFTNTGIIFLCLCLSACLPYTKDEKAADESDQITDIGVYSTPELDEFSTPQLEDTTIWPRIRNGFRLENQPEHRLIRIELEWYKKNTAYLSRVMKRAGPFLHYILEETEKRNLPTELVLLPIVESAFQPFAYSHGRAAGIWQFIPATGRLYGLKQNWWYDGRRDIAASTQAALRYLGNLNKLFKGNWMHALAAYNSGPGTVQKAISRNKRKNRSTDFWSLKLPRETRAYVPKLLALKELILHPEQHEITLRCIQDLPGFVQVDTGSQLDLALAADLADIDVDTLYQFNPGFNRWATSPTGPHNLLLPIDSADVFKRNLASLKPDERIRWKRHRIKDGETLSHIAIRYDTTVRHLKKTNNLRNSRIRAGKYILIPVASRSQSHYSLSANQRKKSIQRSKRGNQKHVHTVKYGESFWLIARRYGVSMHKLARWNAMAIKDKLQPGQKLVIWGKKHDRLLNIAQITDKPSDTIRSITYTVRNGDSLSRIAWRYRVSIRDLHRWNKIRGKYLQPGQRLKLFVDITRQAGENS